MRTQTRMYEKRSERIDELWTFSIAARHGIYQGDITLNATEAEKLLRLLRKLKRLEAKQ